MLSSFFKLNVPLHSLFVCVMSRDCVTNVRADSRHGYLIGWKSLVLKGKGGVSDRHSHRLHPSTLTNSVYRYLILHLRTEC